MPGWFSIKFNNKFVSANLSLLSLIFCRDDPEYMVNFYCA